MVSLRQKKKKDQFSKKRNINFENDDDNQMAAESGENEFDMKSLYKMCPDLALNINEVRPLTC